MNALVTERIALPGAIHPNRFKTGKTLLTALAFLFLALQTSGQSSFSWYFGNHAGIKFNANGTTVPLAGSNMNTNDGCAVTSDTAGVIMFYSDGVNVWNNSSATPVCTTLLGGPSSCQAAIALAIPGTNCQRFLIFTTKGIEEAGNHDLGVALVNVTGASPNYLVSVSEPALSVLQPAGTVVFAEKLAATSDLAGGYWVIAHNYLQGSGTANTFYKYHITAAGFSTVTTTAQAQAELNLVQQTQSIGSNHQNPSAPAYNSQGQMKFSKTGQKLGLVMAGSKIIDLFNFDILTGNLTTLASTTVSPSNGNLYGCEFSPLGNMFYASEGFASSGTTIRKLYQYDISGGVLSSPYTVASGSNQYSNRYKYNALQLGPNDKIYCSEELAISFLSVIQNPNSSGSACGWSSMTEPIANTNALGLSTVISNSGCICLPSPGAITGPSVVCPGAVGKVYSVVAVPGATGYNWIVPAGVIVTSGNNTNIITVTFTGTAVSGTFRANATNPYCTGVNSPPFHVTINLPPAVNLGSDQSICQGQSVTFDAGACQGCTYQWAELISGQTNIGTNQTYTTGISGIYAVTVTDAVGCTGSDQVQLSVQTALPVSVSITASANPVCAGTPVTFSAVAQPGGTIIDYAWKIGSTTVSAGTSSTYTYVPSNGDCIVCEYSTNSLCASGSPATSNTVCMTVNQTMPVSVSITASQNPVCSGTQVIFTALPVNPGGSPLLQWYVNTIPLGGNSSTFTYTPANGDCIICSLNSSSSCVSGNPALSNQVCMTVNQTVAAGITVAPSANPVCAGTPVTFSAVAQPGGTIIDYTWSVSGTTVSAGTSSTYTYVPSNGDCIVCEYSTNSLCTSGSPATSNTVCMTVNQTMPVSVAITASVNPVCSGNPVIFTALPVNPGGSPLLQWYVNTIPLGGNSSTFTYTPANGDCIICSLNSSNSCVSGNPALSNQVCMTVIQTVAAGISVAPSANPVCAGTLVTFTASPANGGGLPEYQWKINLVNAANGTGPTFSYVPGDGEAVTCTLTSSESCTIANPVTSSPVTMMVSPLLPVSIAIDASANPVCAGTPVAFTTSAANGGISPGYQWKINLINAINATGPTFSYVPGDGDVVTCTLLSSENCTQGNPVTSASVAMTVNALMPVSLTIDASANPYCAGSTVIFSADAVNGGTLPGYQWYVNGIGVGSGQGSYAQVPDAGDQVSCVLTSSETCTLGNPATSPAIVMIEHPVPVVTFLPCFDMITLLNARPYLLRGGLPPGGAYSGPGVNTSTREFSPLAAGTGLKTITYSSTNSYGCVASMDRAILVKLQESFTCGDKLVDVRDDDKEYETVPLGTQCWMSENLNYGSPISYQVSQTDNCLFERYVRTSSSGKASSFYQWDELMNYTTVTGAQGLCPAGWHIPTLAEWEELLTWYSGPGLAGGWLKDKWKENGFDSYQLGLLYQNNIWAFHDGPSAGSMYWTSANISTYRAAARGINNFTLSVSRYDATKGDAFNVRCLKD
jgi:uncharacterized protein (TIGR02145 family)